MVLQGGTSSVGVVSRLFSLFNNYFVSTKYINVVLHPSQQKRGVNFVYFKGRESKWQENGRYCVIGGLMDLRLVLAPLH